MVVAWKGKVMKPREPKGLLINLGRNGMERKGIQNFSSQPLPSHKHTSHLHPPATHTHTQNLYTNESCHVTPLFDSVSLKSKNGICGSSSHSSFISWVTSQPTLPIMAFTNFSKNYGRGKINNKSLLSIF